MDLHSETYARILHDALARSLGPEVVQLDVRSDALAHVTTLDGPRATRTQCVAGESAEYVVSFAQGGRGRLGAGRTASLSDVVSAVRAWMSQQSWNRLLIEHPFLDPHRWQLRELALRLLEREPTRWRAAVLQAPAVAVPEDIPMALVTLVRVIARLAPHAPVRKFFKPERATRDEAFQDWMRTDPLTYRGWVRAATGAHTYRLIRWVRRDLHRVVTPLLLTVGDEDLRVTPATVEGVAEAVGGPAEVVRFAGLRHEAHQEPERDEVVASWTDFLSRHAAVDYSFAGSSLG